MVDFISDSEVRSDNLCTNSFDYGEHRYIKSWQKISLGANDVRDG